MDRGAFQSPRGLGRLAVVLLGVVLAAGLANIGSNVMQLDLLAAVLAILVVQRQTENQIARSSGDAVSEVFG